MEPNHSAAGTFCSLIPAQGCTLVIYTVSVILYFCINFHVSFVQMIVQTSLLHEGK